MIESDDTKVGVSDTDISDFTSSSKFNLLKAREASKRPLQRSSNKDKKAIYLTKKIKSID